MNQSFYTRIQESSHVYFLQKRLRKEGLGLNGKKELIEGLKGTVLNVESKPQSDKREKDKDGDGEGK